MSHSIKRRLARGIGAAVVATAASATLAVGAAGASTQGASTDGLTVRGDPAAAPFGFVASLEGRNEVLGGDPDGQALELIGIKGNTLSFSVSWRGISAPTEAAIHAAGRGADGPVVVPLFAAQSGQGSFASGSVTVTDPTVLDALRANPGGFYTELRNNDFPNGVVRGQLHQLSHAVSTSGVAARQESVVFGSQIYGCTVQADGTFAFTQRDVDAHLTGGIHHTFVRPVAGPPQWQAPDGSAVTGTRVVTRNANGAGNIAELDLDATQIGDSTGLLANAVEVLRLNTVGGVAPSGTCDPSTTPTVSVPYQADYLFING